MQANHAFHKSVRTSISSTTAFVASWSSVNLFYGDASISKQHPQVLLQLDEHSELTSLDSITVSHTENHNLSIATGMLQHAADLI
eukprot:6101898-Amphidinium_carterae.1